MTVFTKETFPRDWARTQNNIGLVLGNQAIYASEETRTPLLSQAIEAYHAALTVFTKKTSPQNWAMTQNNLGIALSNQGEHTRGEAGASLLAQAVEAYQAALAVLPKDELLWSSVKYNLFVARRKQEFHHRLNQSNPETPH